MNRCRFAAMITTLLVWVFPIASFAADSRITAVTVYSDRAIVTRTTSSDLIVGEHAVTFENLPAALLDESVQASGKGVNGATILDVRTQTVFIETAANDRVKTLEDQIKALQKQRRLLDDRVKILEEQRGFVQRMLQASTTLAGTATTRPSLDEWQKLAAYSDESLGKIASELQSIDTQKEDVQAKEATFHQQLGELRTARGKRSKTVIVRVAITGPGKLEIALRYAIPNAGWAPAYDARLRSADRTVELSYFGNVRNGTGEDWNNVALTLSTARPGVGGAAPELKPWIADVFRPNGDQLPIVGNNVMELSRINRDGETRLSLTPVDVELGRGNGQVFTNIGATSRAAAPPPSQPAVTNAGLPSASVEASVASATFKIPVAVSIPGNNITQKVPIAGTRLGATLQYQSTPKMMEAAFLSAYATNTSDYSLIAGPMNTFFDDTFVATSNLKTVMPGEKFELALGVDDGISVKRRVVNRFTEETGLTNKSHRVTYEVLVTLTNNKLTPERVVFKEPTPISRDEKIVIKLLTPQEKEMGTLSNPKEVTREEDGKIVWRVNLRSGEKREFTLKLSIEHPGDIRVAGVE
jgi:hypothetical protein